MYKPGSITRVSFLVYCRWEQDQAFEESLAADKAKEESVALAQRQAAEAVAKVGRFRCIRQDWKGLHMHYDVHGRLGIGRLGSGDLNKASGIAETCRQGRIPRLEVHKSRALLGREAAS